MTDIWKTYNKVLSSFEDDDEDIRSRNKKDVIPQSHIEMEDDIGLINCKSCGKDSIFIDYEEGNIVCESCGLVSGAIYDYNHEYKNACDDKNNASRMGMPINEHFKNASLSTIILGHGKQLYRRYLMYNSMSYNERRLLKNFKDMDRNVEEGNIPESVRERAKTMFKIISEDEPRRGACKNSNMAACMFFASRNKDMKQNKDKLSKCFNIKKKKFTQGCTYYKEMIFNKEREYYKSLKPISVNDEIDKISKILEIEKIYINIAKYVAYLVRELGIVTKASSQLMAVLSVIFVSEVYNLGINKKDLVELCNIGVNISKVYGSIMKHKNLLIPTRKLFEEFFELGIK